MAAQTLTVSATFYPLWLILLLFPSLLNMTFVDQVNWRTTRLPCADFIILYICGNTSKRDCCSRTPEVVLYTIIFHSSVLTYMSLTYSQKGFFCAIESQLTLSDILYTDHNFCLTENISTTKSKWNQHFCSICPLAAVAALSLWIGFNQCNFQFSLQHCSKLNQVHVDHDWMATNS